jgi:predicted RNA-binding protein YlqC (UPF0109 family)
MGRVTIPTHEDLMRLLEPFIDSMVEMRAESMTATVTFVLGDEERDIDLVVCRDGAKLKALRAFLAAYDALDEDDNND